CASTIFALPLRLPVAFPFSLDHQNLPPLPPRRSSDLDVTPSIGFDVAYYSDVTYDGTRYHFSGSDYDNYEFFTVSTTTPANSARSEEHTSELQSRENLVCRILLETNELQSRENIVYRR